MKTLPVLTLSLGLAVATVSGVPLLLTAQDGNAGKQTESASQPAPIKDDASKLPSSGKTSGKPASPLRRNEKSAATALVTMEAAREKLVGYRSVKAKIVESVTLGDRKFRMSGTYLQGTDLKLRLEYDVEVGSTKAKLIEVCDGQILWTHHMVGKEQRITRRNVRQILTAAGAAGATPQNLLTAELGLGGLPSLMASIQKSLKLERQWEQDVGQHEFIVVEGGWKQAFREKFLGPGAPDDQALPPFVPDRVRLYFDKESLFPRRILYLKQDGAKVHHPMVALDLIEVEWNGPVDEKAFAYTPPENVPHEDSTRAYISQFEKPAAGQTPAGAAPPGSTPATP